MIRTFFPERRILIPNRSITVIENSEFSDRIVRFKKKTDQVEFSPEFREWQQHIKKQLEIIDKYNNSSN